MLICLPIVRVIPVTDELILKILGTTKTEIIHMFTCYKLLLILGIIPICNVNSGVWLLCCPETRESL